ncbi:hypothetical protein FOA43_002089 [Brettanomyces nanus]|uniref:F-box domain-containing protein n=1 Tax=Eeniella nana TaxID=13502 RepID=A0A875S017_EENNA|nr:uncharacterized protein FOA43_002089 [Brettanomyces nanus]QPG74756.1 hypothetical protein FOA43_002089 [Brettanomyces nanus]
MDRYGERMVEVVPTAPVVASPVELSPVAVAPSNWLASLPTELLIIIFSHLDPTSLRRIALVCKSWYRLTCDNIVWRQIFRVRFPLVGETFTSVIRTAFWRQELICRETLIKTWYRGRATRRTYTLAQALGQVSDCYADFLRDRFVAFDANSGRLAECRMASGHGVSAESCSIPGGTTAYSTGRHFFLFGRWDGAIFGSLVDHKNILLNGLHQFQPDKHSSMVTAAHVCPGELGKPGYVGAFTGDQQGNVFGWDLREGKCLVKVAVNSSAIVKISSDGRSNLVVLSANGDLNHVTGSFQRRSQTTKICTFLTTPSVNQANSVSINMLVDYGGGNVVLFDDLKLEIYSFVGSRHVLQLQPGEQIFRASLEENQHRYQKKDDKLVGGDPLFMAVLLRSGTVLVVNVRETEYHVIPATRFVPQMVGQLPPDDTLPPVCAVTLNALVILVGSRDGRVEMYDIVTGDFCRKVSERVGKRILANSIGRAESIPVSRILIDEKLAAGVVVLGPIVQFFKFGDFYKELENGRGGRKSYSKEKKRSVDEVQTRIDDYEYQRDQRDREYDMFIKYNGEGAGDDPEEEQLELALALSASIQDR